MIGGLANAILTILISKKNINHSIESTQRIITERRKRETENKTENAEIKTENAEIKTENAEIKTENAEIKEKIDTMEYFIEYFKRKIN